MATASSFTLATVRAAYERALEAAKAAHLDTAGWSLREGLAAAGMAWTIDGAGPHGITLGVTRKEAEQALNALTAGWQLTAALWTTKADVAALVRRLDTDTHYTLRDVLETQAANETAQAVLDATADHVETLEHLGLTPRWVVYGTEEYDNGSFFDYCGATLYYDDRETAVHIDVHAAADAFAEHGRVYDGLCMVVDLRTGDVDQEEDIHAWKVQRELHNIPVELHPVDSDRPLGPGQVAAVRRRADGWHVIHDPAAVTLAPEGVGPHTKRAEANAVADAITEAYTQRQVAGHAAAPAGTA